MILPKGAQRAESSLRALDKFQTLHCIRGPVIWHMRAPVQCAVERPLEFLRALIESDWGKGPEIPKGPIGPVILSKRAQRIIVESKGPWQF